MSRPLATITADKLAELAGDFDACASLLADDDPDSIAPDLVYWMAKELEWRRAGDE